MLTLGWEELRERSRDHADLSESERRDAVAAFSELQDIFGDRFFTRGHPLFSFFLNGAAWPCKKAIWFADALKSLKQHPDFANFVKDLLKESRYGERMTVLYLVDILRPAGFSFIFDKEISWKGKPKKPDLFIRLNPSDPGFFIEVTSLLISQKQHEADGAFYKVDRALWPTRGRFVSSGKLECVLSGSQLQEVLTRIEEAIARLSKTGFETVEIKDAIQLAIATEEQSSKFQSWCAIRGMEPNSFSGPSVDVPELDRISFKLRKKQEQLPTECANVVVIYCHLFCLTPGTQEIFEQFARLMEPEIQKYSHIGYLILVFRWAGVNPGKTLRYRDHLCVNRQRFDFECDTYLIFKNPLAAKAMPSSVEERFLEAFSRQCDLCA